MGDATVSEEGEDLILVNRFYLRGVSQVDQRTGQRIERTPGASGAAKSPGESVWTDD